MLFTIVSGVLLVGLYALVLWQLLRVSHFQMKSRRGMFVFVVLLALWSVTTWSAYQLSLRLDYMMLYIVGILAVVQSPILYLGAKLTLPQGVILGVLYGLICVAVSQTFYWLSVLATLMLY